MKKIIIILISLLSYSSINSQSKISLGVYQDFRLAYFGDDRGNFKALNILNTVTVELQKRELGYYYFGQSIEYADLRGGAYWRYEMIRIGYNFLNVLESDINWAHEVNYALIRRWGTGGTSWGVNSILSTKLYKRIKVAAMLQMAVRSDLVYRYNAVDFNKYKFSVFVGLQIDLTKIKLIKD